MKTSNLLKSAILLTALFLPSSNLLHAQSSLTLSSAPVPLGGSTALNLSLASPASNRPVAVQWTFNYPATSMGSVTVSAGPALSSAGKTLSCIPGGNSYKCVAWGMNSNVISDGVVATLSVTPSGSGLVPVTISNVLAASLTGDAIAVTATGGIVSVTSADTVISSITCSPVTLDLRRFQYLYRHSQRIRRRYRRPEFQFHQSHRSRLTYHSRRFG